MYSKHYFIAEFKATNWDNFLFYDLETVENIYIMKKLKNSNKIDQNYLNPLKSKYVAFGCKTQKIKNDDFLNNVFKKVKINDYTIYYNIQQLDYKIIAETLLQFAYNNYLKGFVSYNGNSFDFNIIAKLNNVKTIRYKNTLVFNYLGKTFSTIDLLHLGRVCTKSKKTLDNFAKTFDINSKNLETAKNLYEYVINDVYIMLKLAEKLQDLKIEKTPTATGRKAIVGILKQKGIKKVISKSFNFFDYNGGRTDIFKAYVESCYVFDANSLYPSVMSNFLFPAVNYIDKNGNAYILENEQIQNLVENKIKKYLETINLQDFYNPFNLKNTIERFLRLNGGYLLYVKINSIKNEFKHLEKKILQYFPFSYKDDENKRVFTLKKDEIYQVAFYNIAFLKFFDFKVVKAIRYAIDKYIFADFYKNTYKKRLEYKKNNDPRELLLKIEMNSSYGILGMRSKKVITTNLNIKKVERFIKNNSELIEIGNVINRLTDIKFEKGVAIKVKPSSILYFITTDKKVYKIGKDFDKLTIPIFALLITEHAKFWLNSVIFALTIGLKKEVYYCDTDSVFTNATKTDFEKLQLLGNNLLQFKFEKSYKNFIAFAPKSYVATNLETGEITFKAKGTGNAVKKIIVINNFKQDKFGVLQERVLADTESVTKFVVNNDFWTSYNKDKLKFKDAFKNVIQKAKILYPSYNFHQIF